MARKILVEPRRHQFNGCISILSEILIYKAREVEDAFIRLGVEDYTVKECVELGILALSDEEKGR